MTESDGDSRDRVEETSREMAASLEKLAQPYAIGGAAGDVESYDEELDDFPSEQEHLSDSKPPAELAEDPNEPYFAPGRSFELDTEGLGTECYFGPDHAALELEQAMFVFSGGPTPEEIERAETDLKSTEEERFTVAPHGSLSTPRGHNTIF